MVWEGEDLAETFAFFMYSYEDIPQMPGYPQGTSAVEEIEYVEDPKHEQFTEKEPPEDMDSADGDSVLGVKSLFDLRNSKTFLVHVLTAVMKFHHDHHP